MTPSKELTMEVESNAIHTGQSLLFDVFYALPQPYVIRDTSCELIFKNELARSQALNKATNYYQHKKLQRTIQKKAALLFKAKEQHKGHCFEIEHRERDLEINQILAQTPTGESIILETITDITEHKINHLVSQLLSWREDPHTEGHFAEHLCWQIAHAFQLDLMMVAVTENSNTTINTLSCMLQGEKIPALTFNMKDSSCQSIYKEGREILIEHPREICFPENTLAQHRFASFYGLPLINNTGEIIGVVAAGHHSSFSNLSKLKGVLDKVKSRLEQEVTNFYLQKEINGLKTWMQQTMDSYEYPISLYNKKHQLTQFNIAYEKTIKQMFDMDLKIGMNPKEEMIRRLNNQQSKGNLLEHLNQRKERLSNAFKGNPQNFHLSVGEAENESHFSISYHPIYNHEKTEVEQVLLLTHNLTELVNSRNELKLIKKHYDSIFETNMLGIGVYDTLNERWLDFNDQFLKLFGGTDKKEGLKYKLGYFSPEFQPNGQSSKSILNSFRRRFEQNEKFVSPWTNTRMNGDTFPSEISFIPLNDDKQPGLYCVAIKDLSELMDHQNLLEQKNLELEQYIKSNFQLENLAYSACHDLKEPLRTIGMFTQLIYKKYNGVLDDRAKEYMGFIINGVNRMNYFVDGLFEYSRVRENKNEFEEFSLVQLLKLIQFDLNQSFLEKNARIEWDNIPDHIIANKTKIKQLFQNLIANALKFQQPGIPPVVNISCTPSPDYWHFKVRDNGIGIAKEFFDQIFILFRKLHSKDIYEGSGIGLALCKEIVEQHQGAIQVTSVLGEGTTFSFGIAKDPQV